ncbi:MAG TPA: PQQ-dependent sugar dehydrogenase, partial [Longimicrobiales bacterium]|nr:PQQ-dependent sugar dehydrogenase [Longimicrobiales bacterium]
MRNYSLIFGAVLVTGMVGCNGTYGEASSEQKAAATAESTEPQCDPVETRSPNGRGQRPAFKGQTRACSVRSNVAFDVAVVARGLEHPWAVEPLPGGDFLVTEKPGRMRIIAANGQLG